MGCWQADWPAVLGHHTNIYRGSESFIFAFTIRQLLQMYKERLMLKIKIPLYMRKVQKPIALVADSYMESNANV